MVDWHAGIVDRRMHHAVRIGLRRPYIIIDSLGEGFVRNVELEDGDDFPRACLFDEIAVVKSPVRRDIGAEAAAGMAMVAAWPRADIEHPDFENVAPLGALHR